MENPRKKRNKLPKQARLSSLKTIDALFASGESALAYPVRMLCAPAQTPGIKFFVSIPKKRLRHAVDRVLMRRRIREAFRQLRADLNPDLNLNIAFIYVGNITEPYARIDHAIKRLTQKFLQGTGS